MVSQINLRRLVAIIGPPAIVSITVAVLFWLPNKIRIWSTIWILASLPVGILIGHCVLSEKKERIRPFPPRPVASNETDRVG